MGRVRDCVALAMASACALLAASACASRSTRHWMRCGWVGDEPIHHRVAGWPSVSYSGYLREWPHRAVGGKYTVPSAKKTPFGTGRVSWPGRPRLCTSISGRSPSSTSAHFSSLSSKRPPIGAAEDHCAFPRPHKSRFQSREISVRRGEIDLHPSLTNRKTRAKS